MPIERRGRSFRVRARWNVCPEVQFSFSTLEDAYRVQGLLTALRSQARWDVVTALAEGELDPLALWRELCVPERATLRDPVTITRAHTLEYLKSRCATAAQPLPTQPTGPGIEALFNEFLREASSQEYLSRRRTPFAPSTLVRYACSCDTLFTWDNALRSAGPQALTSGLLERYSTDRRRAGASPSTVNRDLDAIQSFLTWMRKRRPALVPPRPEVEKMSEPKPLDRAMTEEHFAAWSRAFRTHPDLAPFRAFLPLFILCGSCGLRIDEAQSARRCDVIVEGGRPLRIKIEAYPGHLLKSPGAARVVALTATAIPLIEAQLAEPGGPTDLLWPERLRDYHRAHHAFQKACIVAGLHDCGKKYLTQLRRKLEEQVGAGALTRAAMEVQLEKAAASVPRSQLRALYSPHSLRHTFATRLDADGMNLNDIRLILGQASIATTQRYVRKRLTTEVATDAAARSERLMPFGPGGDGGMSAS